MKRGLWFAAGLLLVAATALFGCGRAREGRDASASQAQEQAVQVQAVGSALTSLAEMTSRLQQGQTDAGRQQFHEYESAFGRFLGPVSLKDPNLAKRIATSSTALRGVLATSVVDKQAAERERQALVLALNQASNVLSGKIAATASANVGPALAEKPLTVEVKVKEYQFIPPRIEVERGTRLTIRLINNGTMRHELELKELGVEVKPVAPGGTGEITFTTDRAGLFNFECDIDGHAEKGMRGVVVVK